MDALLFCVTWRGPSPILNIRCVFAKLMSSLQIACVSDLIHTFLVLHAKICLDARNVLRMRLVLHATCCLDTFWHLFNNLTVFSL